MSNLERIEQLKHFEELLGNCIGRLWEEWSNVDLDTIENNFKRLGFTKDDMDYWFISEEIEDIKRQCYGEEEEEEED